MKNYFPPHKTHNYNQTKAPDAVLANSTNRLTFENALPTESSSSNSLPHPQTLLAPSPVIRFVNHTFVSQVHRKPPNFQNDSDLWGVARHGGRAWTRQRSNVERRQEPKLGLSFGPRNDGLTFRGDGRRGRRSARTGLRSRISRAD